MRKSSRLPVSALLLAGGRGTRMGGNKLFLEMGGTPLLEVLASRVESLFTEIVLCVGYGERERAEFLFGPLLEAYRMIVVEDRAEGRGPLEGLHQGLAAMRGEWGFLLPCDMLTPQEAVIRKMWAMTPRSADVSAARLGGRMVSVHAFYRKSCLPHVDVALDFAHRTSRGGAKIISFYPDISLNVVDESDLEELPVYKKSFANFNTQEELAGIVE